MTLTFPRFAVYFTVCLAIAAGIFAVTPYGRALALANDIRVGVTDKTIGTAFVAEGISFARSAYVAQTARDNERKAKAAAAPSTDQAQIDALKAEIEKLKAVKK